MNDPIRLRADRATAPGLRAVLDAARPTPTIPAGARARTRPQPRRTRPVWVAAAAAVVAWLGWKPLALAAGILTASATYLAIRPGERVAMTPPAPASAATASVAVASVPSGIATANATAEPAEPIDVPPTPTAAPRPPGPPRRVLSLEEPAPSAAAPAPSPSPSKAGRLEEEVRLLGEGRSALDADPSRALAAADSHAQRFPGGQLRLERELLAIDALERLGRRDAARARARAALLTARGSIYEARLHAHE